MLNGKQMIFLVIAVNSVLVESGRVKREEQLDGSVDRMQPKEKHEETPRIGRMDQNLLSMLSKIAKVRLADESPASDQDLKSRSFGFADKYIGDRHRSTPKFFKESNSLVDRKNVVEEEKYQCEITQDVYIAEISEKLPAYTCKFKNHSFVLSSERFLHDRRSHFDVDLDEDTFRHLEITSTNIGKPSNIVPAMLVLRVEENVYKIRILKNSTDKGEK